MKYMKCTFFMFKIHLVDRFETYGKRDRFGPQAICLTTFARPY